MKAMGMAIAMMRIGQAHRRRDGTLKRLLLTCSGGMGDKSNNERRDIIDSPMSLLTISNLRHTYGTHVVLDGATLSIEAGEKIGLVGRNGSGKTTLMKAIRGDLEPDSGSVQVQKGARVGYLSQHPEFVMSDTVREAAARAFERLHQLHAELEALFEAMAVSDEKELDRLLKRQAELETEIATEGGYAIDHKIEATLQGLGFSDGQVKQTVDTLSGGQKARLGLARLLLEQPDLLLLDEPTNHLDIDGRRWLERFLADEYEGAVIVVSHDRWLLDRVVSRIAEVERGMLREYPGNYHSYIELRHERMLTESRRHAKQLDKIRAEEAFIRKYKEGQRAKQARGRASRLERYKQEELVERPIELDVMRLKLPIPKRVGDIILSTEDLAQTLGDKDLFEGFSIDIRPGDRIGIIGANGIGKTTMIRTMLGDLEPTAGTVRSSPRLSVGWFRQTQSHIDLSLEVWEYLQSVITSNEGNSKASEQQARDLAGAFLFSGTEQDKQLELLSGGERARAVLAGLVSAAHNLIVLDEPSNHLDIPAAERLEQSLIAFGDKKKHGGALILISHDRALLEATCTQLIVFEEGKPATIHSGRYSELLNLQQAEERRQQDQRKQKQQKSSTRKKTQGTTNTKGRKPKKSPLERMETDQLEEKIEIFERRRDEIDQELADPDTWNNRKKSSRLESERKKIQEELEPLEFEWSRRADEQ